MSLTVSNALCKSVCLCGVDGHTSHIVWNRSETQTPTCCRGKYDNRILFEIRTPKRDRNFHAVKILVNNKFRLEAGEIHGITTGAQFDIYCADDNDRRVLLRSLKTDDVAVFSTSLGFNHDAEEFTIPKDSAAYGLQIHAGDDATVTLAFLMPEVGGMKAEADLLVDISKHLQSEKDQAQFPRARFRIVEMSGHPDVVISTDLGPVVRLGTMDDVCLKSGLDRLPYTLSGDVDTVLSTIRSSGEFFWDLRRVNSRIQEDQRPGFHIEAHWLTESSLNGQAPNLIDDGAIRIDAGHKNALRFTIRNPFVRSFHVWLFAFNMLDLAIGAPLMLRYLCSISN